MGVRVAALAALAVSHAWAAGSSHIYVYAQRLTYAKSWIPISCNGAVVAELKRGRFFAIDAAPGRYTLGVKEGIPAPVEVRAGEDAFVRLDWSIAEPGGPRIPGLHTVRPDQARRDMRYLSYIDGKKVLSSSVSKRDPREPEELKLKTR